MAFHPMAGSHLSASVFHSLCAKLFQSYLTLCNSMDCSLPVSPVHGILQARILDGVGSHALLRGIYPTQGSKLVSCITGRFFTV